MTTFALTRPRIRPDFSKHHGAFAVLLVALTMFMLTNVGVRAPIVWPGEKATDPPLPFVLCSDPLADINDPLLATARPRPVARVVSSEPLAHAPGKRVTMAIVDFPPGAHSPPHRHGGSVSVFVLSGTIYSKLEGTPMGRFKPGDTFFEPLGIIHEASGNDSPEHAQILAVFVHEEGATLTTYLE
jgi:quercetin dioxygenase-like cupin family protein